ERSACTPAKERETAEARSESPGLPSCMGAAAATPRQPMDGTTLAVIVPSSFGVLLLISMIRYARPNTVCSFGEKLTRPDSVGTLWNFCITAASVEPVSDP